ncbi:hypothetical protein CERSUDRAFT_90001 [Gelatoporia subvermispora B]|uniref:F-box domain-containing protein n=1 Tax=Ceriporiopsis subvermispora (strain B) TaxID=914234 RepID=M2RRE1_CERS8|nr:hypothetical protein CERSUDRAFT_90001 [Gelatoporia subvermispora B]
MSQMDQSSHSVGTGNPCSSTISSLPVELLQLIFAFAVPPSAYLDWSLCAQQHSPWLLTLRLKKRLIRVCKLWRLLATSMLYEEVALRRAGQILALARTIRDDAEIASLIRTITLECYIPLSLLKLATDDLMFILEQSRKLNAVTVTSSYLSSSPEITSLALEKIITNAASRLRSFCCVIHNHSAQFTGPYQLSLNSLQNIVSLTVFTDIFRLSPGLEFHNLEDLNIVVGAQNNLHPLLSWAMPRLTALGLFEAHDSPPPCFDKVLQMHGTKLRTMTFRYIFISRSYNGTRKQYLALTQLCPSLEHLIIDMKGSCEVLIDQPIDLKASLRIDMWTQITEDKMQMFRDTRTAPWTNTRLLDDALYDYQQIPHLLSPESCLDDEDHFHRLFDYVIVQTSREIYRLEQGWDTTNDLSPWELDRIAGYVSDYCPDNDDEDAFSFDSEDFAESTDDDSVDSISSDEGDFILEDRDAVLKTFRDQVDDTDGETDSETMSVRQP